MMIEGDMTLFAVAFLASQNFFNPLKVSIVVFLGVIIGDILWYWAGKKFKGSSFFVIRWASRVTRPFDDHLKKRTFRTIFLSKFAYGLHHILLSRAGSINVNFRKFLIKDIISSVVWIAVIGSIGYFSGYWFSYFQKYLRYVEVGAVLVLIIFFNVDRLISIILRRKI